MTISSNIETLADDLVYKLQYAKRSFAVPIEVVSEVFEMATAKIDAIKSIAMEAYHQDRLYVKSTVLKYEETKAIIRYFLFFFLYISNKINVNN